MKVPKVPSIDVNADLKIDSVKMADEDLPREEKEGKIWLVLGTILGIFILLGVAVLAFFYFKAPAQKEVTVQLSPTTLPQATVTPVLLKKEEINFEILNASGKSGEAARIRSRVEKLGYKVKAVGNSDEKVTGMQLFLVTTLQNQKDILLADLKKEFPDIVYTNILSGTDFDARIVVGK